MPWTETGVAGMRWYLRSLARFVCAFFGMYEFEKAALSSRRTVVIVLDPLRAYEYLWSNAAHGALLTLLDTAAEWEVPIVLTKWTRTLGAVPDVVDRKGFWSEFLRDADPCYLPDVEPYGNAELRVRTSNAFAPTDSSDRSHLLAFMRKRKCDTVVLAGCWTEACVHATAVAAAEFGLRAVVVRRACVGHPLVSRWSLAYVDTLCGDVVEEVNFE